MTPGMQVKRLILRSGSRRRVIVLEAGPLVPEVGAVCPMDDGIDYTVVKIEDAKILVVVPVGAEN